MLDSGRREEIADVLRILSYQKFVECVRGEVVPETKREKQSQHCVVETESKEEKSEWRKRGFVVDYHMGKRSTILCGAI